VKRKMFFRAEKLLFERAAKHRNNLTFADELLWNYLRTKPLGLSSEDNKHLERILVFKILY